MEFFSSSSFVTNMDWVEAVGWAAVIFTLTAYSMRTMLIFRVVALSANVLFLTYGYYASIYPTLALHGTLILLNGARLLQIIRDLRQAKGAEPIKDWAVALKPFMTEKFTSAGQQIFARGDTPDRIYLIAEGEVRLDEIDKTLSSGDIFGEIGFFIDERKRTMTATSQTDCRLLVTDEASFVKAYYQSPALGLSFLKLIANRLQENVSSVGGRLS